MHFPDNKVDIITEENCIRVTIQMVHPKWISSILLGIACILFLILIASLSFFQLLQLMGPGALILSSVWLFFIYRIGKVACWHRYGQEFYLIADLAFTHQRSYGFYTTDLTSIKDVSYQIGFQETSEVSTQEK